MNIDRGKTSFTDEEIQHLRERLAEYKAYWSLSWQSLGQKVGVPGGTLSQWVPGKYAGDNAEVARKVNLFFLAEAEREELELQAPIVPGFQHTQTSRRIHSQLRWAQRGKMTVIVGAPGVGKTAAARQYQASTPNVALATMSRHCRAPSSMLREIMNAAHGRETRNFGTNLQDLFHVACDYWEGRGGLIITDETQNLQDDALELLRALHDAVGVGVAMMGNATVLTRVQGGARRAEFAQLYSRVSLSATYERPDAADVEVLLNAWNVAHPLERKFLEALAAQPGCLRTITQVLELATLTAQQGDEERTLEHIKYAWQAHGRQLAA
jgi:DNA transposition AAA+ family ATPase